MNSRSVFAAIRDASQACSLRGTRVTVSCLTLAIAGCGGGGSGNDVTPQTYAIGGTVSGLAASSSFTLQNGGSDSLVVSGNGAFTMPTKVASGTMYSVAVSQQPTAPAQTCTVANGAGTVASSAVTNINVTCNTAITGNNAGTIISVGNNTGETLLQLSSFLGERLRYLSTHLAATATETCADPYHQFTGGTATYTFTDSDSSGSITAGDTVTVSLAACLSQSMADSVTGSVTLQITAPSHGSSDAAFAANASLTDLTVTGLHLNGTVGIEYDFAETEYDVSASVGSVPVQFTYVTGGFLQPDSVAVSNVTASKAIDYTQPRYSVSLAETFASQNLQGTFTLTTPQALGGRLNTFPDTGAENFTSGSDTISCTAQNIADNESCVVELNGVTQPDPFIWNGGVSNFLWWEPRGFSFVQFASRPAYPTSQLGLWQMTLMFTEPQQADPINEVLSTGIDAQAPIKLFFNGPVDSSTAVLEFDALDLTVIPALAAVSGPIVTVTAQTQLQQGTQYRLLGPNRINTTWSTTGAGAIVSMQLTTLNSLQAVAAPSPAVAAPGQTITLTSTGSTSAAGAIAHYLWTQASGPAVSLVGATTASASFVVPAGAQSGDALHFTLKVTDVNGATDTVPVTAFVQTDLTQPFLYYRTLPFSQYGQTPEGAVFESTANGTVLTTFDVSGIPVVFRFGYQNATTGNVLQFMPGTNNITPGTYSSDNPPGNNALLLTSYSCGTGAAWTMTIFEAQGAPDGTAAKFSADFTMSCPGEVMPSITGSVRIGSTVPLP